MVNLGTKSVRWGLLSISLMFACSEHRQRSGDRPIAVAGPNQSHVFPAEGDILSLTFDGRSSFLPGTPDATLSYHWTVGFSDAVTQIDGNRTSNIILHVFEPGLYVVELVVSHGEVESEPAAVIVSVQEARTKNTPPQIYATILPSQPVLGDTVSADASLSSDPDGEITGFSWRLTRPDGISLAPTPGAVYLFTASHTGVFLLDLTVTDNGLGQARETFEVEVRACDEARPGIEICNGRDDDCDGLLDEGFDADGDGVASCSGDCDDASAWRFPGAFELCDGIDNDCDDGVDEGYDTDGDGFAYCSGDCDDDDPNRSPNLPELCDGLDQDCDGLIDEGFDLDDDGWTTCEGDCAPDDPLIYPGQFDACDGIDNNCDELDGYDADGDNYTSCQEDCDDDAERHPGNEERPGNGVDEDCDGEAQQIGCPDRDGDGFCNFELDCDTSACARWCDDDGACQDWDFNDDVAEAYPGAEDDCDGYDNDNDGEREEDAVAPLAERQYGVCAGALQVCQGFPGWAEPNYHNQEGYEPSEVSCDGLDNDCDDLVDEAQGCD